MKYLVKQIKVDINRFLAIIRVLIFHKNRHLRKFVCQALSYVLRKFMSNSDDILKIVKLVGKPNDYQEAQGISDLFFEMCYGA